MFFIEVSRDNHSSSKQSFMEKAADSAIRLQSETSIASGIKVDRKRPAMRLRLSVKPTRQDASCPSMDLSPATMARRTVHATHCKTLRSRIMPYLQKQIVSPPILEESGVKSEFESVPKMQPEKKQIRLATSSPIRNMVKIKLERLPQPGLETPAANSERPPSSQLRKNKSISIESLFKLDLTHECRRTQEKHKTITSMKEGKNQGQRIDTNCELEDLLQKNKTFMAFVSLKRVQTASSGVAMSIRKPGSKVSISAQ